MKAISVWKATRAMARQCLRRVCVVAVGTLWAASSVHAGVVNGDFESGDFTGWTVTHYRNNGIGTFPPTQKSHLNLQPPATAPVTQVVSAASGTPADAPDAPGQAVTIPFQGSYSARINARGNQYRASGIQQSAQMLLSDVDPTDGKVHLRMAVAPVIQDGGHAPAAQAYFYVEVRNVTKGSRLFYTFNFAAQPGVPWQAVGGYQYTGWQAIDVAPGNGLLDVGDTVEVEIIAAGCNASGHSGEVYVDSIGPFFAGLLVSATGPTTAQPLDSATYTYTYSNNSGVMVFNSQVSATSPQIRDNTNTATIDAVFQSVNAPAGATCQTPAVGSPGTVTCDFGSLVDRQSGTFQIVWGIPANASTASPNNSLNHGTYSTSATGASTVLGPLVQTKVVSGATLTNLGVSVSDGVSAKAVGSNSTYTVVVTNNGPSPVIGAALTQPTVSGMTVGSWTCSGTGGAACQGGAPAPGALPGGGALLDIPVGGAVTLTFGATVTGPSNASTVFKIDPPSGVTDSDTANNTAGDTNAVAGSVHTLALTKSGAGSGTVVSVPAGMSCGANCSMPVADGGQAILTATAASGSLFTGWTGACTGPANPCTVPSMTADAAVTANFALAATVTMTSGPGGTTSPATSRTVGVGGSVTYTLSPDAGNYPAATGSCNGVLTGNTYTVSPVTADCNVAFSFGPLAVTATAGQNGTVTPLGVTNVAARGNTVVYTITPDAGYVARIASGGNACGGTLVGNTYTTNAVNASCTVAVSFVMAAPASIPTLSQWGLMILSALMAGFFAFTHRRHMR
ncbi:MAG: IPTL-CTERM sorting domain-containing protein [Comamonadaceae bacterium]|nr:MAG: IPTL-CTERM sorting domain-containing protein [Comamonadaceae bacterium]